MNPTRAQQQVVRQQGMQKIHQQVAQVRPVVRPAAAPRKIMPAAPAPPAVRSVAAGFPRQAARPAAPKPGAAPARPVMPKPAAPKVGAAAAAGVTAAVFTLNASRAHPTIAPEISSLQYALTSLQDASNFDSLIQEMNSLNDDLQHALNLLEAARNKGYKYQKNLDDLAVQTLDQWQGIYDPTLREIQSQHAAFQQTLAPLNTEIPRLNANLANPAAASGYIRSTETTVNNLLASANTTRSNLQRRYSDVRSRVSQLTWKLNTLHWALTQLDEAKYTLEDQENLVMAVKARWDREGDDDPEGILHLTDKRLIFERKEKVATKKVLFITTEKELVHEIQFAEPVGSLKGVTAQSKGLFGHQDFLEVAFSGSLGNLSLHLDGQDSQEWATLTERVRSGKIADDRAVAGALSFADLTGELTAADIAAAQTEVSAVQGALLLSDARAELENLENDVRSLERSLADVRARGYQIEKDLEAEIAVLVAQWERIKGNAGKTLDVQAGLLAAQSTAIQGLMTKLAGMTANLAAARPVYMQLKSAIASAEAQAAAALETIYGQFDDYAAEVAGLDAHLDWVDWMLDALATASFQLLATESGIAATEATYARPGMEAENGVLFLTDQRLLWEDRVGDYEVKVEVPLAQVESVSIGYVDEAQTDETLAFKFASGAPLAEAAFDIAAPVGETWRQMVGRARNGDYAGDRATPLDPAEIARVQNAPTQCSHCGGQFTAPVLRGQVEIACEFCGTITRI
jgi:predicted  nucleic acid-binding Zn-ribbon protein